MNDYQEFLRVISNKIREMSDSYGKLDESAIDSIKDGVCYKYTCKKHGEVANAIEHKDIVDYCWTCRYELAKREWSQFVDDKWYIDSGGEIKQPEPEMEIDYSGLKLFLDMLWRNSQKYIEENKNKLDKNAVISEKSSFQECNDSKELGRDAHPTKTNIIAHLTKLEGK